MVRTKVAKSALTLSTPTLAKIAVSAAKAADSTAQNCQDDSVNVMMPPCARRSGIPCCLPAPCDRALGDAEHRPAGLAASQARMRVAHFLMQRRVAHHAALADALRADLELRLDQRDQRGARLGERERAGSTVSRPMKLASHTTSRPARARARRRDAAHWCVPAPPRADRCAASRPAGRGRHRPHRPWRRRASAARR